MKNVLLKELQKLHNETNIRYSEIDLLEFVATIKAKKKE
jgi:hypothetical protein